MTTPRLPITPLPPGSSFARYAKGLHFGHGFAAQNFADTPVVPFALNAMLTRTKGAVTAFTTGNAPDLASLGVVDSALTLRLANDSAPQAAFPFMVERPLAMVLPRLNDSGTGGGPIQEGQPLPVIRGGLFDTTALPPVFYGSICVLVEDILRRPGNEAVIRDALLGVQGRTESFQFLSPSVAAVGDAPPSITHGATEIAWDGDAPRVLRLMLASIQSPGTRVAWIGRPLDLALIAASLGGAATATTLLGLPIIPAPNAPRGLVVLADFGSIIFGAQTLQLDKSDQASLEMSDTPTNSPAAGSPEAPVATQLVSLFQANSVAFKIGRFMSWQVVRDHAVAFTVVSGSPA